MLGQKTTHENDMAENIEAFRDELQKTRQESRDAKAVSDKIDAYNKYEDYIIKSRQANHTGFVTYGPVAISIATVFIGIVVGGVGVWSSKNQRANDQGNLVLKVLQSSDRGHYADNLLAFQGASLIDLSPSQINDLAKHWQPPSRPADTAP